MYAGLGRRDRARAGGRGPDRGPRRFGLDAAFSAVFLAALTLQLRTRAAWLAALGGAAVALALVPVAPAGVPILAASTVSLAGARRRV